MSSGNKAAEAARAFRFGVFEVDVETRELRKRGLKVNLQEQPFRVLCLLLGLPGQLLSRESLKQEIWNEESLADSELGLNTAIKKIRIALGDAAENPQFVETLPKLGYRFIAPVQVVGRDGDGGGDGRSAAHTSDDAALEEELEPGAAALENKAPRRVPPEMGAPPEAMERPNPSDRRFFYMVAALIVAAAAFLLFREAQAPRWLSSRTLKGAAMFVYRTAKGAKEANGRGIGGFTLLSAADRALAFDYDHSGKSDHLVLYRPGAGIIWIVKNVGGVFSPVYEGNGLGGFDLKSAQDRVMAFDYDHSGKADHLVLYRPGTPLLRIVKNEGAGVFTPVYVRPLDVGGDRMELNEAGSSAQQMFAFDYSHSGKVDYLVIYRPEAGSFTVLKNIDGGLTAIHLTAPGGELWHAPGAGAADRAFAFDYEHSGKLDYLVVYRPGHGSFTLLKNADGVLTPVFEGQGIGGFDLKSPSDQAMAFDYAHSGKLDHLFLYRPGAGLVSIVKNVGGKFTPVYAGNGAGGYDFKSWKDQAFAFDYVGSEKMDYLTLYRPGTGTVSIIYFP